MNKELFATNLFAPWNTIPLHVESFTDLDKVESFFGAVKKSTPATRDLSDEALELANIRTKLGMTQADFAISVGQKKDTIVNIENGRIQNVPPELLEEARKVLESIYCSRVKPLADLQILSMPEVLDRWRAMMSVDSDAEGANRELFVSNLFSAWNTLPLRVESSVDLDNIESFFGAMEKSTPATRDLSDEALELVNIRTKLGMTQADFAISVGQEKDKIVNIENGRIRNVPPEILEEARRVLESAYCSRVKPLADLQILSMPEILDRWWAMMGVDCDAEGAILLGVCDLTIERWRSQPSRPSARDILRYDLIARKIADKRKIGDS